MQPNCGKRAMWEGGWLPWFEAAAAQGDGDMVEINVPERRIQLLIPDEELVRRMASSPERPSHPAPGMLAAYRAMVSGAASGAVWL